GGVEGGVGGEDSVEIGDPGTLASPGVHRVQSTDGVEVAVHDLGGDGPPLVLVHATGFCGGVLAPLARSLAGLHSWALDVRGHGSSVTPSDLDFRWSGFADDVLAVVDRLELSGAYGFGHSCGGAAVLDAEARRPGTFRSLYVYEPIVWPTPPPAGSRDFLIEGALRRKDRFESPAAARANFAAKRPFSGFAPESLDAYVGCGFDEYVRLRCRPQWEAAVYRQGLVHDGFSRLGRVECPVMVASGDRHEAVSADVVAAQAAALPHARTEVFEGLGHLGPMEDPLRVAESVAHAFAD
ncbi:MAG TPA: alpha/beta hydrolase, partial [Acidimicrobiales bacterium]